MHKFGNAITDLNDCNRNSEMVERQIGYILDTEHILPTRQCYFRGFLLTITNANVLNYLFNLLID